MKHRIIAINLPQFHPFKENDEWWGKGFTEWTNVTKAKPRFKGHYQPHLPTETGFYDLRLPEARQMQADMAKKAGIYGFCYYHYWFNGHQLMERPVDDILKSGEPDFPFMLCWANENWARNWDGGFKNVLIEQNYSVEDDIVHMRWLCKNVFCDKRYIRVDGKPVFIVYRTALFPDLKSTVKIWRQVAKEDFGIELYLMHADFHDRKTYGEDPQKYDMDASFDFQPLPVYLTIQEIEHKKKERLRYWSWRIPYLRSRKWFRRWVDEMPEIYSYNEYVEKLCSLPFPDIKRYPCVSPGFDNSARRVRKKFLCFPDSSPKIYGKWLSNVLQRFIPFSKEENFVFINAWNEWAEGNHLEPDTKWKSAYLDETKKVIFENNL